MTKYFFTTLFSLFSFLMMAQEAQNLGVIVRPDTQLDITDSNQSTVSTEEGEKTIKYDMALEATVVENNNGNVTLQIALSDFGFTSMNKGTKSSYDSKMDKDYLEKRKRLLNMKTIIQYNTHKKAKKGPELAKGAEEFITAVKSMVKPEYQSDIDQLMDSNYLVDLCLKLLPIKNNTEIAMGAELGYSEKKESISTDHNIVSAMTLTPKLLTNRQTSLSKTLTETITEYSPASDLTTITEINGNGDVELNFKTGLLMSYNFNQTSIVTVFDAKGVVVDSSEVQNLRIITVD